MHISVSSLGFCGHPIYEMRKLPKEIGVEIFYEWGADTYWKLALDEIMQDRTGKFSIHAPYQGHITELSLTKEEDRLFEYLKQPFNLYHRYGGEGYVVHMNAPYTMKLTVEETSERMKLVADRLHRFNRICQSEGVTMLVENLAFGPGLHTLCDQENFLKLFSNDSSLSCIVDTGHAVLGNFDIMKIQKTLGTRLVAYHIHDNDGIYDLHQRIETGVIDWKLFIQGMQHFTPDAHLIMEYNEKAVVSLNDYVTDAKRIETLIKEAKG